MADLMRLGILTFGLETAAYQELVRSASYVWSEQSKTGTINTYQYLGEENQTLSLNGVILPHFRGGFGIMDSFRDEASKGEPMLLVSGLGDVLGYWVIKKIEETQTFFLSNGCPRKIKFNLELLLYNKTNG